MGRLTCSTFSHHVTMAVFKIPTIACVCAISECIGSQLTMQNKPFAYVVVYVYISKYEMYVIKIRDVSLLVPSVQQRCQKTKLSFSAF